MAVRRLSKQIEEKVNRPIHKIEGAYEGNYETIVSTGSTLLDLAITGGRIKGGGLPGGIIVEIFGPSTCGKTVLLCEIAGNIQKAGGDILFHDPEARLNKQFATLFGLDTKEIQYSTPDTVNETFIGIRSWEPKSTGCINGIFTDSLAALSTELEMGKDEGDKMGGKRAKDFSEQLRRTARIIQSKNQLFVCSNQIRQNMDAGQFGQKYTTPGGMAFEFYASLRLRGYKPEKIKKKITINGKEEGRIVGVEVEFEVFKSSLWKPYHTAPVIIYFDYGIDDIRANLQFIKDHTRYTVYTLNGESLDKSMDKAISIVEEEGLEKDLKENVINLWEEIESKFDSIRKPKHEGQ